MQHMKKGEVYVGLYLSVQRSFRKLYTVVTLILSSAGLALGWKLGAIYPMIACVLIAVMQILRLMETQVVISEAGIDKLCELREKYTTYFHKLEHLWMESESDRLQDAEITRQFYDLRQHAAVIESLDSKMQIWQFTRLSRKAESETVKYFQEYHV